VCVFFWNGEIEKEGDRGGVEEEREVERLPGTGYRKERGGNQEERGKRRSESKRKRGEKEAESNMQAIKNQPTRRDRRT